ncbi:MAG TPA: hypothetical protein DCL15_08755 [Chloroflexi bacterium]|nr:hypothetical protein [Chloroflexota bacterium]
MEVRVKLLFRICALLIDSTIQHRTSDIFPEALSFWEDEQSLFVLSIRKWVTGCVTLPFDFSCITTLQ